MDITATIIQDEILLNEDFEDCVANEEGVYPWPTGFKVTEYPDYSTGTTKWVVKKDVYNNMRADFTINDNVFKNKCRLELPAVDLSSYEGKRVTFTFDYAMNWARNGKERC